MGRISRPKGAARTVPLSAPPLQNRAAVIRPRVSDRTGAKGLAGAAVGVSGPAGRLSV
jgi:hypothetical protein